MFQRKNVRAVLAVLLSAAMLLSAGCAAPAPEAANSVPSEFLPFYFLSAEDRSDVEVFFINGNRQIPYVSPETWQTMFQRLYNEGCTEYPADPKVRLRISHDAETLTYTRENGASMTLDFQKDAVRFSDFDAFTAHGYAATLIDLLHEDGLGEQKEPQYFLRLANSYDRSGGPVTVDLAAYGLDLVCLDGQFYLPVQIMADLLIGYSYVSFLYNTEALILYNYGGLKDADGGLTALGEICYSAKPQKRSRELIDFTYGELCMVIDCFFGLKEEQDIESADELFARSYLNGKNLRDMLHSVESEDADKALAQFCYTCISDLHTTATLPSWYSGYTSPFPSGLGVGDSTWSYWNSGEVYAAARARFYPDGVPGYEEVGNTAYVCFDEFTLLADDYYANPADADTADTIGLIEYAHAQICRENSPIENVVLDLSCNHGGEEDSAIYVIAWMLGRAAIHMKDTFSGASATTYYAADVNMDHAFTEADSVSGLRLYCLISPVSFSCGNLVPAALKASGAVTLIGRPSGGGSCTVQPVTTASGNIFQISGYKRLSTLQNGSYYPIDRGVQPDFLLDKPESFYDRDALTDYINGLF